jgi:C-terminal processing protease CtpA/Prc
MLLILALVVGCVVDPSAKRSAQDADDAPLDVAQIPTGYIESQDGIHFHVDRERMNEFVHRMRILVKYIRTERDEAAGGYRVVAVKPGAFFDRIGLKHGDLIVRVNGRRTCCGSKEGFYEDFLDFKRPNYSTLFVRREGAPVVLHYDVR